MKLSRVFSMFSLFMFLFILSCDTSSVESESDITEGKGILRSYFPDLPIVYFDFSKNIESENGDIYVSIEYAAQLISDYPPTYNVVWDFHVKTNLNTTISIIDSTDMDEINSLPISTDFFSDIVVAGVDTIAVGEQASDIEQSLIQNTYIVNTQNNKYIKFQINSFNCIFELSEDFLIYFDWQQL